MNDSKYFNAKSFAYSIWSEANDWKFLAQFYQFSEESCLQGLQVYVLNIWDESVLVIWSAEGWDPGRYVLTVSWWDEGNVKCWNWLGSTSRRLRRHNSTITTFYTETGNGMHPQENTILQSLNSWKLKWSSFFFGNDWLLCGTNVSVKLNLELY